MLFREKPSMLIQVFASIALFKQIVSGVLCIMIKEYIKVFRKTAVSAKLKMYVASTKQICSTSGYRRSLYQSGTVCFCKFSEQNLSISLSVYLSNITALGWQLRFFSRYITGHRSDVTGSLYIYTPKQRCALTECLF